MNSVFSQSEKGKCKLRKYYWQFTRKSKNSSHLQSSRNHHWSNIHTLTTFPNATASRCVRFHFPSLMEEGALELRIKQKWNKNLQLIPSTSSLTDPAQESLLALSDWFRLCLQAIYSHMYIIREIFILSKQLSACCSC